MSANKWEAAFSSKDMSWRTPPKVFHHFNKLFNFNLDAAASPHNALCSTYYTKEDSALEKTWKEDGSRVWVNPPYGRKIADWIKKCKEESEKGCIVAALIFSRTDTRWWHDHIMGSATMVYLIKGRIKFLTGNGKETNSAPAPSCLVVWVPNLVSDNGTLFKSVTIKEIK
jgi:phage N-6-adenine-methyltransferase